MSLPDILDPEDDFGLPKENYSVVRDPRKDFDFAEYERMAVAMSMLSYTAPRAWVVVSAGAIREHKAVWGETSAVVPTCSAVSTGVVRLTFPATVHDLNPTASRVSTTAVQFSTVHATLHSGGQIYATCAANVITVRTQTTAGVVSNKNFSVFGYR